MAPKNDWKKSSNVFQIDDQKGVTPKSSGKNRTAKKNISSSNKKSNRGNKKSTLQKSLAATSEKPDEDEEHNSIINLNNEKIEEEQNDENIIDCSFTNNLSYTLVRNIEGLSERNEDELQHNLQTLRLLKVSSIPKIEGKPSFVVLENKVYKRNLDDYYLVNKKSAMQSNSQNDVASQTEKFLPEQLFQFGGNGLGSTTSEIIGHNAKNLHSKLLLMNNLNMRTFHINTKRTRTMQHVMNLDTIKHIIPQKFIAANEVTHRNSVTSRTSYSNRCSSTISQGTNVFDPCPTLHTSAVPNGTSSSKSLSDSNDAMMLNKQDISNKPSVTVNVAATNLDVLHPYDQAFYAQQMEMEQNTRNKCTEPISCKFEGERDKFLHKSGNQFRSTQMLHASSSNTLIPEPSIGTQTNVSRLDLPNMFEQSTQKNAVSNNYHQQLLQPGLCCYMPNERIEAGMYSNIGAINSSAPFIPNYNRLPINNEKIGYIHSRFSNRSHRVPQDCGIFYHNTPPVVPQVTSMQYSFASQQSFGMTKQYENAAYQNMEMPKHCGNYYRPCPQLHTFPTRYACTCNNCVFPHINPLFSQDLIQRSLPSYAEHPSVPRSVPLHTTSQNFNMPANDTFAIQNTGNTYVSNATHLPFNRGTFYVPFPHYSQMHSNKAFACPYIVQATESATPQATSFLNMDIQNGNVYYDEMHGEVVNTSNANFYRAHVDVKNFSNSSNQTQSFKTNTSKCRMKIVPEATPRMVTKETEPIQHSDSKQIMISKNDTRRKLPPPPVPPKRYKRSSGNTLRVLGLKNVKLPSQYSVRFGRSCLILRAVPTPVPKIMKRLNHYPSATAV